MIQLHRLTKKFGHKTVVNQVSLAFKPGFVTGLLGPNGAGKSTTMKMIVSLVHPSEGYVTIDGKRYKDLDHPIQKVGTLIDPSAVDHDLTARQHLSLVSSAANIPSNRVDEILQMVGLAKVQSKQIKQYSLGMKQRLGIATALIGDPETILLDEPFNGLDLDGIKWLRSLFKQLAKEGKSVIVSSHLMGEIQAIADHVIIMGQGNLLANMSIEEMNKGSLSSYVYVEASDMEKLARILHEKNAKVHWHQNGLEVRNITMKIIGQIAYHNRIVLYELKRVQPTLEDVFTEITAGKVDYVAERTETP